MQGTETRLGAKPHDQGELEKAREGKPTTPFGSLHMTNLEQHVPGYWESEFQLRPKKRDQETGPTAPRNQDHPVHQIPVVREMYTIGRQKMADANMSDLDGQLMLPAFPPHAGRSRRKAVRSRRRRSRRSETGTGTDGFGHPGLPRENRGENHMVDAGGGGKLPRPETEARPRPGCAGIERVKQNCSRCRPPWPERRERH
jgi:hypothetical protein